VIATTLNEGAALQMISGVPTWIGGTPPPPPAVGDLRDGGIVFWVDGNGGGKVCALEDAVKDGEIALDWYEAMSLFESESYTNSDAGTGVYDDWSLPSRGELQLMYANLQRFGCSTNSPVERDSGLCATRKANFSNGYYWCSTEVNFYFAWDQSFSNGNRNYSDKRTTSFVRAVRAF
jgi:hypothetical protein